MHLNWAVLFLLVGQFSRCRGDAKMCDQVICQEVDPASCKYGLGKDGCCYVCARGPGETCLTNDKECGIGMYCHTGRPSSIWTKAGVCVYMDAPSRK
ncbi:endothelial cell-specific molecule 1-like [Amblyomma americanum]